MPAGPSPSSCPESWDPGGQARLLVGTQDQAWPRPRAWWSPWWVGGRPGVWVTSGQGAGGCWLRPPFCGSHGASAGTGGQCWAARTSCQDARAVPPAASSSLPLPERVASAVPWILCTGPSQRGPSLGLGVQGHGALRWPEALLQGRVAASPGVEPAGQLCSLSSQPRAPSRPEGLSQSPCPPGAWQPLQSWPGTQGARGSGGRAWGPGPVFSVPI